MASLHLILKGVYFDQIAAGDKAEEYRLCTGYWKRRLEGKDFDCIILRRGYSAASDVSRTLVRPWRGFVIKTIVHEHFQGQAEVYAIKVN